MATTIFSGQMECVEACQAKPGEPTPKATLSPAASAQGSITICLSEAGSLVTGQQYQVTIEAVDPGRTRRA